LVAAEVSLTRPFVVSSWEPTGICVAFGEWDELAARHLQEDLPRDHVDVHGLARHRRRGLRRRRSQKFQTTPSPVLSPGARFARSHCTATPLSTGFGLIVSARFGGRREVAVDDVLDRRVRVLLIVRPRP
jgi:hypothetical protein